jgi:hypothetical protein
LILWCGVGVSACSVRKDSVMGTRADHRRYAEECVVRAQRAEGESDKVCWLTLAQSWMRLAEHVAQSASELAGDEIPETASLNLD